MTFQNRLMFKSVNITCLIFLHFKHKTHLDEYRVYQGFGQASLGYDGLVLGLGQPSHPKKLLLMLKVVKSDSKIIISLLYQG